jgi:hypothetical protein
VPAVRSFLLAVSPRWPFLTTACKENGTVVVQSTSRSNGVKAVDESRLKAALATRESSKIPWGRSGFSIARASTPISSAFRRSTPIAAT